MGGGGFLPVADLSMRLEFLESGSGIGEGFSPLRTISVQYSRFFEIVL